MGISCNFFGWIQPSQTVQKSQGQPPFGCIQGLVNNGINYQLQRVPAGFLNHQQYQTKKSQFQLKISGETHVKYHDSCNSNLMNKSTNWDHLAMSQKNITFNSLASPSQRSHIDSLGCFFLPTRNQKQSKSKIMMALVVY